MPPTTPPTTPAGSRDRAPSWPALGALTAGSALVHALLVALLVPMCEPRPQDLARAPRPAPPPEQVVEYVEEEEEAPAVEAPKPPEISDPPRPTPAPKAPPVAALPPQPKPKEEPEPTPKPKEPPPKPADGNLMIDQPKVAEPQEPPPDTKVLGPQDRRVLVEEQPRQRALKAQPDAPESQEPPPPVASDEQAPEADAAAAAPREASPKGDPERPPTQDAPPTPKQDTPKDPEPAPSDPQAQRRKGEQGDKGAKPSPKAEDSAQADPLEEAQAEQRPTSPEQAPDPSQDPGQASKQGQAGDGAKVDLMAAVQMKGGATYQELFGARDSADAQRMTGKQRRLLGRWEQRVKATRAALENFVPNVRYGNQIAINARGSVYAPYIAEVHRNIHLLWANGYLRHLDLNVPSGHPLSNQRLVTLIELVIDGKTGVVKEALIVESSGVPDYDTEAVRVGLDARADREAPSAIVSPDGNVYLHWHFWRDHRQCGTFGVSVYVLDKTGKVDTYQVQEELDTLEKKHGIAPHKH